jgi:hypothetical protein
LGLENSNFLQRYEIIEKDETSFEIFFLTLHEILEEDDEEAYPHIDFTDRNSPSTRCAEREGFTPDTTDSAY